MREIEKIVGVQGSVDRHRESLLARLASWRLEHPKGELDISELFQDILAKIQDHYFAERRAIVQRIYEAMLALDTEEAKSMDPKDLVHAQETYKELELRFGYDASSARESLKFMLRHSKKRKKS